MFNSFTESSIFPERNEFFRVIINFVPGPGSECAATCVQCVFGEYIKNGCMPGLLGGSVG